MKEKKEEEEEKKREKGAFETRRDAVSVTKHPGALYFFRFFFLFFTFFFLFTVWQRATGVHYSMSIQTLKINSFFFSHIYFKERKNTFKYYKNYVRIFSFFLFGREIFENIKNFC